MDADSDFQVMLKGYPGWLRCNPRIETVLSRKQRGFRSGLFFNRRFGCDALAGLVVESIPK